MRKDTAVILLVLVCLLVNGNVFTVFFSSASAVMALAAIFGRRKTPEEMLRQNQRALNKVSLSLSPSLSLFLSLPLSLSLSLSLSLNHSHTFTHTHSSQTLSCIPSFSCSLIPPLQVIRELDRERNQLERQEKKLVVDIKKMAKSGQMEAVKIMAKDLVRTRNFIKKFILMRANIQAIALKIQTLKSQAAMANAMKGMSMCLCQCTKLHCLNVCIYVCVCVCVCVCVLMQVYEAMVKAG